MGRIIQLLQNLKLVFIQDPTRLIPLKQYKEPIVNHSIQSCMDMDGACKRSNLITGSWLSSFSQQGLIPTSIDYVIGRVEEHTIGCSPVLCSVTGRLNIAQE
jgi:hypothetical protein